MNAQIHEGDCLDVMRGMADGSISHVVTDPPYGQTNEAYESGIAFDPAVWRECYRVTGPNAALVSFAGSPTYHKIATAIEAGGWKVRQMWGWVYRDGFMTSAWPKEGFDRLRPAFDPIVYATKGKVLLKLEREGESWSRKDRQGRLDYSGRTRDRRLDGASGRWPTSLVATEESEEFRYFVLSRTMGGFGWHGESTGHPNQKPLVLMRWLAAKLPASPLPILDPFAGSATTIEAAHLEGFSAVGIEQSPEYAAIARRRIADAATPLFA